MAGNLVAAARPVKDATGQRTTPLAMALRYAHLTKPDVSAKFRRASPLDNLRAGR